MIASGALVKRWATSDGDLAVETSAEAVTATVGSTTVEATPSGKLATITASDVSALIPHTGYAEIVWDCDGVTVVTPIERVGVRYCTKEDIIAYGKPNNDGFDKEGSYPARLFENAIQEAEEAIEAGCRRSFCQRSMTVHLVAGRLNELPVVDASSIDFGTLVSDRQAVATTDGDALVTYGAKLNARIRSATITLAASYLRPRAAPMNARGQSQDGVYVSFELATGGDGSWTGIPAVDAAIEAHRSHRVVVA